MIIDRIDNVRFYQNLSPNIKIALDYIKNLKVIDLKPGKINLANGITVTSFIYIGKEVNSVKFESHRTHLDLEYIVKGVELVQIAHPDILRVKEAYDPSKDVKYYHDAETYNQIKLNEGYFIIYYPDDAHKVGLKVNESEIYKVWVRIPLK
jgi:YhcH/YjgK/YiaL family protein